MTSSDEAYAPGSGAEPTLHSDAEPTPPSGSDSAEARVGAGLSALERLDDRPVTEHAPVYEGLHQDLQDVLAEIDGA